MTPTMLMLLSVGAPLANALILAGFHWITSRTHNQSVQAIATAVQGAAAPAIQAGVIQAAAAGKVDHATVQAAVQAGIAQAGPAIIQAAVAAQVALSKPPSTVPIGPVVTNPGGALNGVPAPLQGPGA